MLGTSSKTYHRMAGVGRILWSNPPARAGLSRVNDTETCPDRFWIPSETEAPTASLGAVYVVWSY